MLQIHPKARTTPAVRAEIATSLEPTGVLAKRYGISTETVRKWRKRGPGDCLDHSTRPKRLPWKASEDERAIVGAVREATHFPLDGLTFAIQRFLPHLNRYSIYRILKAEGLHRLADLPPLYPDERPRKGQGPVKGDETEKSALAFLDEAVTAFPFQLTHVLTDRGSCFTDVFSRRCRELGIRHRMTKPYTPQTNGMVERFNRRIKSDVLT